jgi:ATP-dependent DNA ligase
LLADAIEGRVSGPFDAKPAELVRAAKTLELEGIIAKRKGSIYDPAAEWGLAQVQDQSIPGVRDRRIHAGQSLRCADRCFYDVAELKFVARVRNGFVAGFGERFTSN